MKPDYWERLAGAARRAAAEPSAEMPYGFDARVVARWRAGRRAEEVLPWANVLRAALVCSALIMLLSLAVSYLSLNEREPASLAIADSALRTSLLP